jgi:hypothetical protein
MEKAARKQLIENAFSQVEYNANIIDAYIDTFSSIGEICPEISLKEYIENKKYLLGTDYRIITDRKITELMFLEADEYLAKALCNLCAGCVSMNRGYISWGEVTVYYASFFAIHGLLRIQGKALGMNYVLFPKSIRNPASILKHTYIIVRPVGEKGIHEDVWRKFYHTYSQYTEIDQRRYADAIFFSDVQDIILEVERRNKFNYRIFESYKEIFDRIELDRRDLFNLQLIDPLFFTKLTDYVGDSDRRYLAKAALRVQLLHDLLYLISEEDENLKGFFIDRHRQRIEFLEAILKEDDPISRICIEEGCLIIP